MKKTASAPALVSVPVRTLCEAPVSGLYARPSSTSSCWFSLAALFCSASFEAGTRRLRRGTTPTMHMSHPPTPTAMACRTRRITVPMHLARWLVLDARRKCATCAGGSNATVGSRRSAHPITADRGQDRSRSSSTSETCLATALHRRGARVSRFLEVSALRRMEITWRLGCYCRMERGFARSPGLRDRVATSRYRSTSQMTSFDSSALRLTFGLSAII